MSHDVTPPPIPPFAPQPPPQPPKKAHTAVVACAAAVVAAILASAITVGVTGKSEAKPAPTVTVTETEAASSGDDTEDAAADPTDEETGSDSYSLNDTVSYENDVEVSLSGFGRGTSNDYAAPENTPYAKFIIKISNKSGRKIDASQMSVNCAYGDEGKEGEAIYDDDFDGLPDTRILDGRSLSVPWACELPKNEKFLQVEVSPDYDSEAAIFTGTVK
ncbi:hypothetical protein ACH4S8_35080 [Streptomyces sp. NPDC021080]|uniref:hypothetical protein n=1 Tax=Streptomyces sp. NPDC021080 TaxID=3365110 RepID=UPI0037AE8C33